MNIAGLTGCMHTQKGAHRSHVQRLSSKLVTSTESFLAYGNLGGLGSGATVNIVK
jgi:hypothetical protein